MDRGEGELKSRRGRRRGEGPEGGGEGRGETDQRGGERINDIVMSHFLAKRGLLGLVWNKGKANPLTCNCSQKNQSTT